MEEKMTTPTTPPPWQIPAEITADDNKRPVAEMIDEAARKINASVVWEKCRYGTYAATLKLHEHTVVVDPVGARLGASIESNDVHVPVPTESDGRWPRRNWWVAGWRATETIEQIEEG